MANIANTTTNAAGSPALSFAAPRQLSDDNSQGTIVGQNATDLLGFYGDSSPIPQPNVGPGNIFGNNSNLGYFAKYQVYTATSAVTASTAAETTSNVYGVQSSSVVAVNRPSNAVPGLGVAGYRVSAANAIGINYSNVSSGSLNVSSEIYDVLEISSNFVTTATVAPSSVAASAVAEQQFNVPGATVGSLAIVNKPTVDANIGIGNVRVVSEGVVGITYFNTATTATAPTSSQTYSFAFVPTIAPAATRLVYKTVPTTSTNAAATTTTDVSTAITGLLATDIVVGVSKPSATAGLGIVGYRTAAAGQLNITYGNFLGATTAVSSEIYQVDIARSQMSPIFQVTTAALASSTAAAANTTTEITYTVSGISASTSALVNKPSLTSGLAIVNTRVSAANTLAITWQNNTSTAITPPTETYTIGYTSLQGPGLGSLAASSATLSNSILVSFSSQDIAVKDLRSALINLNLISSV